jgi:hypothetical protein
LLQGASSLAEAVDTGGGVGLASNFSVVLFHTIRESKNGDGLA